MEGKKMVPLSRTEQEANVQLFIDFKAGGQSGADSPVSSITHTKERTGQVVPTCIRPNQCHQIKLW